MNILQNFEILNFEKRQQEKNILYYYIDARFLDDIHNYKL